MTCPTQASSNSSVTVQVFLLFAGFLFFAHRILLWQMIPCIHLSFSPTLGEPVCPMASTNLRRVADSLVSSGFYQAEMV
jgi:hypothetical protein